jgi:hypothetical protein
MNIFRYLKLLFRYLKLLLSFFLFIIISCLGHLIIWNDISRCRVRAISNYFWIKFINTLLNNKIVFINNKELGREKINFINSNHCYNSDFFILSYLFQYSVLPHEYSSISTSINIGLIDKIILNQIDACLISNKDPSISIRNSIKKWYTKNYNRYIITHFEGISKCDYSGKSTYKYVLKPKTIALSNIVKYLPKEINYITDINIIYTLDNKSLICSNKELLQKLVNNENIIIYVDIHKYRLPSYNDSNKWLEDLYSKKNSQIENILINL